MGPVQVLGGSRRPLFGRSPSHTHRQPHGHMYAHAYPHCYTDTTSRWRKGLLSPEPASPATSLGLSGSASPHLRAEGGREWDRGLGHAWVWPQSGGPGPRLCS